MKLFHISDLHIGKLLYDYDLQNSQREVLNEIVEQAVRERPDAILIAGDIYDKSMPSGTAYKLFDRFLMDLSKITPSIPVMIIAGNHDSAQRLQYASEFIREKNIYISTFPPQEEEDHLMKLTLTDEFGEVDFYLLPFMKPAWVRRVFGDQQISDYDTAVKMILEREEIDFSRRNVLIAHQFFTGNGEAPEKSGSELVAVGGIDNVDIACVKDFDYVALGHIHGAQRVGFDHIRYSGTPLKYSASEADHKKGITVVTLGEKGTENTYDRIALEMHPDVRKVRGLLSDILASADDENRDDYMHITLTDEDVNRPKDQLEEVFSHILEVRLDNKRVNGRIEADYEGDEMPDPFTAFLDFYQEMNNQPMSVAEENILKDIIECVSGKEVDA